MRIEIVPNKLKGKIKVPKSKSYLHRVIIASSLSNEETIIDDVSHSIDIDTTIKVLKKIGIDFKDDLRIKGLGGSFKECSDILYFNKSGTTLRLLIPILLSTDNKYILSGDPELLNRPLDPYLKYTDNLFFDKEKGYIFLNNPLTHSEYEVEGNISSQFISGFLFALPLLTNDSTLKINASVESINYIKMTLKTLKDFNIEIDHNVDYSIYNIKGSQKYVSPKKFDIELDFSQAAFFYVAGILGSKVKLIGMDEYSLQGDKEIVNIIKKMGGNITYNCSKESITKGTIIDLKETPDLGPIITVLASLSKGKTKIINAERLKYKESNRLVSISTELNKIGAKITVNEDGLDIIGVDYLIGGVVDSWNDHRVAMALAIASIKCRHNLIIENFECVNKSYPDFLKDFIKLGGKVNG